MSQVAAIIVAAGSSRRMGFDKLAAEIDGKPVLAHTLEVFMSCASIAEIVLVAPEERLKLLDQVDCRKPLKRVDGGSERCLSVSCGLAAVAEEIRFIAVHDAARPFLSQDDLSATIQAAIESGAASLARKVTETLKRADETGFTNEAVNRDNLWMIETPQIFETALLRAAYRKVLDSQTIVTDETSAMELIGKAVKLVASTSPNPKITTPLDLAWHR